MEIAFPPDDPILFQRQLDLLRRSKQPEGSLVVTDATPLGGQLIVELDDPPPPSVEAPAPEPVSRGIRTAMRQSMWRDTVRTGRRTHGAVPAPARIRVLCLHGVGHGDVDPGLRPTWSQCIRQQLARFHPGLEPELEFLTYDDLFDQSPHNVLTYAEAAFRMGLSGAGSVLTGLMGSRGALADGAGALRWTAGMVAQWAENDELRGLTRGRLKERIEAFDPHLVVAHSLGSLIAYDTFSCELDEQGRPWEGMKLAHGRFLISLGSQIGSPFTRQTLGGRIRALDLRHWFHLYNRHDNAFTAPLRVAASNFEQIDTPFDAPGMLDHDATEYLRHNAAVESCWRSVALARSEPQAAARLLRRQTDAGTADTGATEKAVMLLRASVHRPILRSKPRRRALLVGINDYPAEADRLHGCVNDVFLMSSVLQEIGFDAEDIRVVLNERATASSVLERLDWLLEGTDNGMERVFYYSGHGAQIPAYGSGDTVDHKDECLVTHDFNWSSEHAVTDDQFFDLYSQLPYNARFFAIFDCCHSGGMTREGGPMVKGLSAPDDIRHRALRWDPKLGMWKERDLEPEPGSPSKPGGRAEMFGEDGSTHRLGCASSLRLDKRSFDKQRKQHGHKGPYMPVILQACQEHEYSYEYRHGVESYGAFTYVLAQVIRGQHSRPLKWSRLVAEARKRLTKLKFQQSPTLVCPTVMRNATVPWMKPGNGNRPAPI